MPDLNPFIDLDCEELLINPSPSDFAVKATAADKGELVSLLERCYMFLADNSHEAEEDAAELMAAIEKAIDLNEERS